MTKKIKIDNLHVKIFDARSEMGKCAALDIEKAIADVLKIQPTCNIIFAAAPSQSDVHKVLCQSVNIDWSRVNAFHMDEYIGISPNAPQGFAKFLRDALFAKIKPANTYYLNSLAEPQEECYRYSALLREHPTDIVVMGIGENGHIAFNDPHVADFNDKSLVKVVTLDEKCRSQQVNDGCFNIIDEVPSTALTLTIPALVAAKKAFCIVPAKAKAVAVKATIHDKIDEACPASILRKHSDATLYLDADSSSLLS